MPNGEGRADSARYLFIDALRGIAALMVVLFHAQAGRHMLAVSPLLPSTARWVFDHGNTGVCMFFVISGFVIANTLIPREVTPKTAGLFLLRRSVRLDPPYWVSIVLVVTFAALSAKFVGGEAFAPPSLQDLLLHAAYLPGLVQSDFIAEVYWTLCLEIQFYLTFATILVLVSELARRVDKERALDAVLWPCTLFANLWAFQAAPFQVPGLFVSHWYMFLMGVLVWRAVTRAPKRDYVPTMAAVFDLAMLGGAALHFESVPLAVGTVTAAAVLLAGLLDKLHSWLSARPFQFLGAISYSLYLVHNSLTGAGFRVGYMLTGRGTPWLEGLWLVLVMSGCIGGAWLFYKLIEAPSMAFARRIGTPGLGRARVSSPEPSHVAPRKSVA